MTSQLYHIPSIISLNAYLRIVQNNNCYSMCRDACVDACVVSKSNKNFPKKALVKKHFDLAMDEGCDVYLCWDNFVSSSLTV